MANSVSLVLLCLGLTATGVHAICDTVEKANCVADLASSSKSKHMEGITFNLNREEYDEVCSVFNTVDECVRNQTDTCNTSSMAAWIAFVVTYNYLCSDSTKEVYLKHRQCITKKEVASKTTRCDERTVAAIKTTVNETSLCRIYNDGVSCNIGAIKEECGTEIAEILNQLAKKLQSMIYEAIGCTFDVTVAKARYVSGTSGGATIFDTFGVGLLLLILSFIVLAL